MMTYLLQVSTSWIVLYAIYMLFLRKETFFSINRYFLLGALALGLAIPFLGSLLPANQTSTEIYHVMSQVTSIEIAAPVEQSQPKFTWMNLLYLTYVLGAVIVFSRFIYGLTRIANIYRGATKKEFKSYTLLESSHYHLPFSFFHLIFISTKVPLNRDIEKILKHEELHANQWHSLDIVLIELLQVFFWFNPILIFYKKEIRQSHEFLADAYVTREHKKSSYGQLLLRQSTSGLEIALANHFFHSQIKKRITMMYKEKSKRTAMVKYLVAIPVLAAMLFIFSSSKAEDKLLNVGPEQTVEASYSAFPIIINIDQKGRYYYNSLEMEFSKLSEILNGISQKPEFINLIVQPETESKNVVKVLDLTSDLGIKVILKTEEEFHNFNGRKIIHRNPTEIFSKNNDLKGVVVVLAEADMDGNLIYAEINKQETTITNADVQKGVLKSVKKWKIEKGESNVKGELRFYFEVNKPTSDYYFDTKQEKFINKLDPDYINTKKEIDNKLLVQGAEDLFGIKENIKLDQIHQGDPILKVVEEMPRFPGCEALNGTAAEKEECAKGKMLEFIYSQLSYPKEARNNNIEGMTVIQFVVKKDGSIAQGKIIREIGGGAGSESLRVVNSMPKWIPGKQKGESVNVLYTLPVKYKLEGKQKSAKEKDAMINIVALGEKSDEAIKGNLVVNNQKPNPDNADKEELFSVVEEMPRFIGCENDELPVEDLYKCSRQKMLEYIYTNIKYPRDARDMGIEGVAIIELVIEKDGSVSSSTILRDPGAGTGKEAKRVIDQMPNWIPGKQRGKNVRVKYVLPIKYKLEGDKGPELFQNIPNPFREQTKIGFNLTKAGPATIIVYNIRGEEIAQKNIDGIKGYNAVTLTASELKTLGVLYYTLKSGDFSATRKMSILKPKKSITLEIKKDDFVNLKHIEPILKGAGFSECSVEEFNLVCLSQSKDPSVYHMKNGELTKACIDYIKDIKVGDKIFIEKLVLQCKGDENPVTNVNVVINIMENKVDGKLNVTNLIISPNPTDGLFRMSFDLKEKTSANIIFYNSSGQIIKTLKKVSVPFNDSIDLSKYKGQTIFAKIMQGDKVATEKIIVH